MLQPEQFCYWLQGFAEISGATAPTSEQWNAIKEHLNLVFQKVTPNYTTPLTGLATTKDLQGGKWIPPQTSLTVSGGVPQGTSSSANETDQANETVKEVVVKSRPPWREESLIGPGKLC